MLNKTASNGKRPFPLPPTHGVTGEKEKESLPGRPHKYTGWIRIPCTLKDK
jgi:hypothetical protein